MFIIFFAAAVILSMAITPAAIKLCILDKPDYRKIHDRPVPKAGGIGIFIPVLFIETSVFLFFNSFVALDAFRYFSIVFITSGLLIAGIVDDKLELGAKTKLMIQVTAAVLTVSSGIRFRLFDIEALDLFLTIVWIIGIVNAVNLIDGLDGLAAGTAVISCAGFGFVGFAGGDRSAVFLSLIIIGACLGFLRYNFRPARIFMGDAGSVPLGYNLAILGIFCENAMRGKASVIIPAIMLGIPIFDTLLTISRRYVNNKPIFQPDRSHFYNLMMDIRGMGHKSTVLIIYALNTVLAALSCMLAFLNDGYRIASICIIIAAACLLSRRMGFIKTDSSTGPGNVIELNSIKWFLYNGALVPDVPPHIEIKLSGGQVKYLLGKSKAYFLRWPCDFDCGFETEWWYLIRDKSINLDEFDSKRRLEFKKGIKRCTVKKVDAEYIAKNGYEIYKSAFDSYDTFLKPVGQAEFHNRMMSRKDNRAFDFWAAFSRSDGKMIGYYMNRIGPECCLYSTGKFRPDYLKEGVHHALIHEMTNYYLNEMGLRYVCAGARSISHKTNVQEFLVHKLHFRKAFCRLNLVYNPLVKIIITILYPFRDVISRIDTGVINRITVLLRQEGIRRSFISSCNGGV